MNKSETFEIFLVTAPGLEQALAAEARAAGLDTGLRVDVGGVTVTGGWDEIRRANLMLRCASRVLVRIAAFRVPHLAQLDKRARKVPWDRFLRADVPFKVDVTCRKSRIYHQGAAIQRIEAAIVAGCGAQVATEGGLIVKARIEDDLCTISLDTSGEPLHRRGHKEAVGKAPLRETMAAAFLWQCGFRGNEPVVDPMCGSGTFAIEAAEIAAGLAPGRSRAFAFQDMAGFDRDRWQDERQAVSPRDPSERFTGYGYDRDDGAIRMSTANAARAGVGDRVSFTRQPISALVAPAGPPGLVMVNPPYGERIGNRKLLFALYGSLGQVLGAGFRGWRVGLVTSDGGLAKATGLPFLPTASPVSFGGLKVTLYQCAPLP